MEINELKETDILVYDISYKILIDAKPIAVLCSIK